MSSPGGADPSGEHPQACSAVAACLGGPGTACQYDNDCCQVNSLGDACVTPEYQCAARCTTSSHCASNCCVPLTGGGGVCLTGGSNCLP